MSSNNRTELFDLFLAIKDDLNPFADPSSRKIIEIEAGPGSGKTTFILSSIKALYGEYITQNVMQEHKENGALTYIKAGEGNQVFETENEFNLKTNYKKDVHFINSDLRMGIIAFNTDIVEEVSKSINAIETNIGNKEGYSNKKILVKTSHSLLFQLAKKLELFSEGIKTNYSKSDFSLKDVELVLNDIPNFINSEYPQLKNLSNNIQNIFSSNDENRLFNKIFKHIVDAYYESTLIFNGKDSYAKLFEIAQESFKQDILNCLGRLFVDAAKEEVEQASKKPLAEVLTYIFFQIMKEKILNGEIAVGHSYYYKNVYVQCMKDENILLRLFSADNDPAKYLNVLFVDEAQDLTPIMVVLIVMYFRLIERKALSASITIVGDTNQGIYGFSKRENAFIAIKQLLGIDRVKVINKFASYRMPQSICNFINNASKNMLYAEYNKELKSKKQEDGIVYPECLSLEEFTFFAATQKNKSMIIGRTNLELVIAYLKAYSYLSKSNKELTKYLKLDAKIKKEFKELAKKGIDALDDDLIKEKMKAIAGKGNVTLEDIRDNEKLFNAAPMYIKKICHLTNILSSEEIFNALENRASPKSVISFMTAHASKGLENEYVYLLDGLHESLFENKEKTISDVQAIEELLNGSNTQKSESEYPTIEESNIFYVAASRAKKALFMDQKLHIKFSTCIDNTSETITQDFVKSVHQFSSNYSHTHMSSDDMGKDNLLSEEQPSKESGCKNKTTQTKLIF